MMKTESAIYIYAPNPVFNPAAVKCFASFDQADSVILFSSLIENMIEIIGSLKISTDNFLLLNAEDERLYTSIDPDKFKIKFLDEDNIEEIVNFLTNKSQNYQNNLLILSDTIGISSDSIAHCFNLLNIEDDCLVIGKSYSGFISFLAYNNVESRIVDYLFKSDYNYMEFLAHLETCPAFINVMEKFQRILSIDDFKKLYIELSKKESLSYCSQEMHERFTHLFVEHKELLQ